MQIQVKLPSTPSKSQPSTIFFKRITNHVIAFEITGGLNIVAQSASVTKLADHLMILAERRLIELTAATIPVTIARPRIAVGANLTRCPKAARSDVAPPESDKAKLRKLTNLIKSLSTEERTALGF